MTTITRNPPKIKEWRPYPGAQTRFLSSPAYECLYGGAAYPGKTECLVMEALRQIDNPRYNGVFFRRTYPMLEGADGPIARSKLWYSHYGGKYHEGKHQWVFPSGAHIFFRHLENMADLDVYQGDQFQYIAFDELGQFPEAMYLYLWSRCRSDQDTNLRCYIRAGSNPGGYHWVKRRFVTSGIMNKVGYFVRLNNKDTKVPFNYPYAKSRSFIPATHRDNPNTTNDYVANLNQMDYVTKARLADGNWDIVDEGDNVFPDWSSTENVSEMADYNPDFGDVFWAVDDGYAFGQGKGTESYHPRVVLLFQVTPIGGINVFAERYSTEESTHDICLNDILGDRNGTQKGWGYPPPEMAFIDSSAAMFRGAIQLRDILCNPSTHDVVEGLRNVRQYLKDGQGVRLLMVHPRCIELIEEMGAYRYGTGVMPGGDRKPIKADDHGPSAIRYGLWHRRRMLANE